MPQSSVVSDDEVGHYCSMSLDSSLTPPVAEYDRCICTGCRPRHPAGTVPHGTSTRRLALHNQFSAELASCGTAGISDLRRPRPGFPQLRPIFGNNGRSERMTSKPEIEVQSDSFNGLSKWRTKHKSGPTQVMCPSEMRTAHVYRCWPTKRLLRNHFSAWSIYWHDS